MGDIVDTNTIDQKNQQRSTFLLIPKEGEPHIRFVPVKIPQDDTYCRFVFVDYDSTIYFVRWENRDHTIFVLEEEWTT